MKRTKLGVAAMVVALTMGMAACGNDDKDEGASGGTTVEAYDFRFDPNNVTVKASQSVTLTLKNEGKVKHNLTFTEAQLNQDADAGTTAKVTFTTPAAGDYEFYCEYHKDSSKMVGTIHVTS